MRGHGMGAGGRTAENGMAPGWPGGPGGPGGPGTPVPRPLGSGRIAAPGAPIRLVPLLLLLLLLAAPVLPGAGGVLVAQGGGGGTAGAPATLDAVEAAMDGARFEEARRILERWWEAEEGRAAREERQRGLWLRGQLTVDPDGAEILYRRLVLEYPGGEWSDQALLRLARGAEARGEPEVATRFLEILVRDYPLSPHRVEARAHLARLPRGAGGGTTGTEGAEGTDGAAGAGRDGPPVSDAVPPAVDPPAADPPRRDPPQGDPPVPPVQEPPVTPPPAEAPSPDPAPAASGAFTLQFGAFGSESGARSVAAELRGAGLEVRIVQVAGSPLYRVRLGGWPERSQAEARARELTLRGFEVLISTDRERERPAG